MSFQYGIFGFSVLVSSGDYGGQWKKAGSQLRGGRRRKYD